MDRRVSGNRRRPITSCSECYRRKQKCNRDKPCDNCILRRLPEKCRYGEPVSNPTAQHYTPTSINQQTTQSTGEVHSSHRILQQLDPFLHPSSSVLPFAAQVGYSESHGSNGFSGQNHITQDGRGIQIGHYEKLQFRTFSSKDNASNLITHIPTDSVVQELIDVYFSEANWYFYLLEEYYFRKSYRSWQAIRYNQQSTAHENLHLLYFPALLFQVLAVALQFLPPGSSTATLPQTNDEADSDQLSEWCSTNGVDLMATLGRYNPTIFGVQHDLMRVFWLKNRGRGTESWYILGGAIRMAQDMGLHLESDITQAIDSSTAETLKRIWFDEYKRRLWMKLFSWDSHMSLMLGRPRTINRTDCTVKMPIDCDFPADPANTVPITLSSQGPPSSLTPHLFQCAIGHKIHEAISAGANRRHVREYDRVTAIHKDVAALVDNLPPAMRSENPDISWDTQLPHLPVQRQQIANSANAFLLALHRPHAGVHIASRDAAVQAALETLNAQQRLFDLMGPANYKTYMLSVYSLDASIFLAATIAEHPITNPTLSERIHLTIRKAMHRLEWMGEKSPLSRSGLLALKRLYSMTEETTRDVVGGFMPEDSLSYHIPMAPSQFPEVSHSTGAMPGLGNSSQSNLAQPNSTPMLDLGHLDSSQMFASVTDVDYNIQSLVDQLTYADSNTQGMAWDGFGD